VKSLYERVGGDDTIIGVVDELYERLIHDPRVLHHFTPERIPSLKLGQRRWFRSVLGGGGDDERPDLGRAHSHLLITDEQVDAVLGHLDASFRAQGTPDDIRRQVMSIVTRLWLARDF
jgi:hemoglobin